MEKFAMDTMVVGLLYECIYDIYQHFAFSIGIRSYDTLDCDANSCL